MATSTVPIDAGRLKDKQILQEDSLPTADGTAYSTAIDLGALASYTLNPSPGGRFVGELLIEIPALTTTQLPDDDTITFSILSETTLDANGIDGNSTVEAADIAKVTGAGGAGISATNFRYGIYSNFPRYIGVKAVAAGGTGDISGSDMTTSIVFH